jgi:hypothetical protein
MTDAYLTSEELNEALKGATITGFRALPNGREIVLETTAGFVPMTNELKYKLIRNKPVTEAAKAVDPNAETRKLTKPASTSSEMPHCGDVGFSC